MKVVTKHDCPFCRGQPVLVVKVSLCSVMGAEYYIEHSRKKLFVNVKSHFFLSNVRTYCATWSYSVLPTQQVSLLTYALSLLANIDRLVAILDVT